MRVQALRHGPSEAGDDAAARGHHRAEGRGAARVFEALEDRARTGREGVGIGSVDVSSRSDRGRPPRHGATSTRASARRDVRVGGVRLPRARTVPRSARTTRGDLHRRADAGVASASASRSATFSPWIPILVARSHAARRPMTSALEVVSEYINAGWCYTRETPRCDVLRASGPTSKPFRTFASAVFSRRGGAQCDARASGASSPLARWRFARYSPRSRGRGRWRRETRFHAGSAFRRAPRPSCRRQLSGDGFERTDGAPGTRRSRASRRGSRGGRRGRSIRTAVKCASTCSDASRALRIRSFPRDRALGDLPRRACRPRGRLLTQQNASRARWGTDRPGSVVRVLLLAGVPGPAHTNDVPPPPPGLPPSSRRRLAGRENRALTPRRAARRTLMNGPGENGPFGARRRRDGDADALVAGALVALAAFAVDLPGAAARLARERRAHGAVASLTAETRNPQAGDPRGRAPRNRETSRASSRAGTFWTCSRTRDRSA